MDKGPVNIEWFIGAQTNLAYNCLDKHIEAGQGDKIAFYFEGNDVGQQATMTYSELLGKVCQIGNYLKSAGVKKGDDVTIYMPMICELPAAMVNSFFLTNVHIRVTFRNCACMAGPRNTGVHDIQKIL